MKTTAQTYKQFLISSQNNYTCTYLSDHVKGLDENSVYRFLKNNRFTPLMLREKSEEVIVYDENGKIIFDDSVLDKDYSSKIDGVRSQYSGNAHGIVKGIGIVNCVYYNPKIDRFWVIDFRIFDPDKDGKSKIDHVKDMLSSILKKEIPFSTVLMDTWYATKNILMWIHSVGKVFYCPIKINRLVDDSRGERPYTNVKNLEWSDDEYEKGKIVKVRGFPSNLRLKLFRVSISTDRTEYVITNDHTQCSTEDCQKETAIRWNIEQFHREIKQITGIEKNQCRTNRSQRNHICLCMQVWLFISEKAHTLNTTVYQLKKGLLDNYMIEQMRNPQLKYC